jgi:hypothetical protein
MDIFKIEMASGSEDESSQIENMKIENPESSSCL